MRLHDPPLRLLERRASTEIVSFSAPTFLPTDLARLPQLLAYTESLGLERFLHRPKRGIPTLAVAVLWLCLAWRGSARPYHLSHYEEPLLHPQGAAGHGGIDRSLSCYSEIRSPTA
jgi:hypothetical protein